MDTRAFAAPKGLRPRGRVKPAYDAECVSALRVISGIRSQGKPIKAFEPLAINHKRRPSHVYRTVKLDYCKPFEGLGPAMIRTVWLAIACLIGLAALTVIKVGTTSFEAALPSDPTTASSLLSDASSSDASASGALAKADRLDVADEDDAVKPVKPIAITTKVAEAAPSQASSSGRSWRSSYAKRQLSVAKHRKGKLHKTSRRHRSYHASRSHGASKHMVVRKQKKSRRRN